MIPTGLLAAEIPRLPFQVINVYPHDSNNFTQGLVYQKPFLYESSGLYGESRLHKYTFENNALTQTKVLSIADQYFAEGLEWYDSLLYMLTYKAGKLFVYHDNTFEQIAVKDYQGEGWGLTVGLNRFYRSDGSSFIYTHRINDFSLIRKLQVKQGRKPIKNINELEWVKGFILANIWFEDRIIVIQALSGKVVAEIDLSELIKQYKINTSQDVANGIAYDAENDYLYVTGKNWQHLFRLQVDFTALR